jgi:hypothetical protein
MGACDLVCVPRWGSRVSAKYLDGMTHSVDLKGVPLMRCLRCLVMIGLNLVGFSDGQAASSIDPTKPPQGLLFNPGLIQHIFKTQSTTFRLSGRRTPARRPRRSTRYG